MLIVVPWSAFWDRNFFVRTLPVLKDLLTNNFVRGAISGLGVITVWAGFIELSSLMMRRGHAGRRVAVAPLDANRTESQS